MSGLLKFFLILSVILIAAPALASDTGKAAQAAGFANASSAPPAPAAQSFANLILGERFPKPDQTAARAASRSAFDDASGFRQGDDPGGLHSHRPGRSSQDKGRGVRTWISGGSGLFGAEANYYPQINFNLTKSWVNSVIPIGSQLLSS